MTAFVREVVLPGGPDAVPRLKTSACRFKLRHGKSPIDRWGVFAAEPIPARRRVIEYTGQRITPAEAHRRRLRARIFFFWISKRRVIDGAIGGSGAEYVNHGCEPNLAARVRGGRVIYASLRPIAKGEELLIDYKIVGSSGPVACRCGAKTCRGTMNRPARR